MAGHLLQTYQPERRLRAAAPEPGGGVRSSQHTRAEHGGPRRPGRASACMRCDAQSNFLPTLRGMWPAGGTRGPFGEREGSEAGAREASERVPDESARARMCRTVAGATCEGAAGIGRLHNAPQGQPRATTRTHPARAADDPAPPSFNSARPRTAHGLKKSRGGGVRASLCPQSAPAAQPAAAPPSPGRCAPPRSLHRCSAPW